MIIVRTPLRISLAGGGTDFRNYYRFEFGAVCSMAINKYVYVAVNNLSTYFPHRFRIAYSQTELAQDKSTIHHPIVREALHEMDIEQGIDINVIADIPSGTGMGSSSCFTVTLLHALHAFKEKLTSKEQLAREAARLEIDILKEPIGKQDHYACAFGGVNMVRFLPSEQVMVEPLPIPMQRKREILDNLLLFYLGGNREASSILKHQEDNISENLAALDEMRDQAIKVAEVLTSGDYDELGHILRRGWELKKTLAQGITTPEVDEAMETALQAGALGGKLLGAGGKGFLLLYVPRRAQEHVRYVLQKYKEVQFEPDDSGSMILYYGA
jgi:D-glycero-alpha-D-manno-heptose-7-phosphate kinase